MNKLKERKKLAGQSDFMSLGMMFPASIGVGVAIGYFLDKALDTSPILLIIFTLYGIAAGFWNLYKVSMKLNEKKNPASDQNEKNENDK
jgi:ATP synthase protein I